MKSSLRWLLLGLVVLSAVAIASACSKSNADSMRVINGAGATLPYPLYARWSAEYAKLDPKVRINYQSVGSGAGVRQVSDGVVDFGATDEPLSEGELARCKDSVLHVPTTIGAVAVTYNLPGAAPLRLTADLVADVFLGTVTRWDDARIREANEGRALPAEPITVVHRADGSGTSAAFTSYLSRTSAAWRSKVGAGTTPRFPTGVGVKGSEGVAAHVKVTPFTIGYVEVSHAHLAGLPVASVQNRAGAFVTPTLEALDHAARAAVLLDPGAARDTPIRLVDTTDPAAYPITALSYVVLPRDARDPERGAALAQFLWWAVHDGQRYARPLDYAELPPELVLRAESVLRELRAGGRPIVFAAAPRALGG